jgi:hypothetical protein
MYRLQLWRSANLSLSTPWRHVTELQLLLTLALGRGESLFSRLGRFYSCLMDPRYTTESHNGTLSGSQSQAWRFGSFSYWKSNQKSSVTQPLTSSLYRLRHLSSIQNLFSTTLLANNNRNMNVGLDICENEIILLLLITSCLHYDKLR